MQYYMYIIYEYSRESYLKSIGRYIELFVLTEMDKLGTLS